MSTTAILNSPSSHKAFEKIYGLTILERTLHALNRAEVKKAFLVEGEKPDQIEGILKKMDPVDLEVHFVENNQEAISKTETPFFYISEPLVIDPNILKEMKLEGEEENNIVTTGEGAVIFFNSRCSQIPDFDTDLKNQISSAWKIKETENRVFGILTDAASKRVLEKKLIKSLIKPTDGWVSKNLNRPISISISRVLAHTSVTPNQFTVFTGLIGMVTGFFLALGGYWNYLIGGALFHLTSVLDGVDGELARLKFKSSPFGQWLDTIVDNLCYLAALAGIIIGIYRNGASDFVKISGILAVVFAVLALGSLYLYLLRFKAGGTLLNVKYSFQDGNSTFDKIMQVAGLFGKRDLFALIFFLLGIIGQMPLALTYVAIMAFFVFAFSVQAHVQAGKEV